MTDFIKLVEEVVAVEQVEVVPKVTPFPFDEDSEYMLKYKNDGYDFIMKRAAMLRAAGRDDAADFQEEQARKFLTQ